jgi:hypothetical protein
MEVDFSRGGEGVGLHGETVGEVGFLANYRKFGSKGISTNIGINRSIISVFLNILSNPTLEHSGGQLSFSDFS